MKIILSHTGLDPAGERLYDTVAVDAVSFEAAISTFTLAANAAFAGNHPEFVVWGHLFYSHNVFPEVPKAPLEMTGRARRRRAEALSPIVVRNDKQHYFKAPRFRSLDSWFDDTLAEQLAQAQGYRAEIPVSA